jgi:hypothetical protein
MPITTKVVNSHHAHGKVYWIQHYVIKFVSDLRQLGGFLRVFHFPQPGFELTTLVVIGTDYTGSCKSNCHTITTTITPTHIVIWKLQI